MRRRAWGVMLAIAAACLAAWRSAANAQNLLFNPGAELSAGADTNHDPTHPPLGWGVTGGFTVVRYHEPFTPAGLSERVGGGVNLFGGLAGLLGGYLDEDDEAVLVGIIRGCKRRPLGTVVLGPVEPAERSNQTGFVALADEIPLARSARLVMVAMTAVEHVGPCNDGYFDNLSLEVLR